MNSKQIKELRPGLYQIRLGVPIKSLDYVYSYLALDDSDALLIDTGWPSKENYEDLQSSLEEIGTSIQKIKTIVISHLHPDHFGLADQLRGSSPNSRLLMHEAEATMILNRDEYLAFIFQLNYWLSQNGTPDYQLKAILDASTEMLNYFRPPDPTGTIAGGEILSAGKKWNFEVVSTPGHTKGTVCLYDRNSKVLFSGDHVLPTITPNVSFGPFNQGNPLRDYLNSLNRVDKLEVDLVLPSHEYPFSNLSKRIQEIKIHHNERLDDALGVLRHISEKVGLSGYEVASQLKWHGGPWESLGAWEKRAAIMETLAHLEYLRKDGRVLRFEETVDHKPVVKFAIAGKEKTCFR